MKNFLLIGTMAIAIGLIIFLYQRLLTTEAALRVAEQHFTDCQQVTFQLQNELSESKKGAAATTTTAPSAAR
jgi:hypothetical protein